MTLYNRFVKSGNGKHILCIPAFIVQTHLFHWKTKLLFTLWQLPFTSESLILFYTNKKILEIYLPLNFQNKGKDPAKSVNQSNTLTWFPLRWRTDEIHFLCILHLLCLTWLSCLILILLLINNVWSTQLSR